MRSKRIFIVELEGVEPSSKQLTKKLSTCLVYFRLSGEQLAVNKPIVSVAP